MSKDRNKELYRKGFLSDDALKKLDEELYEQLQKDKEKASENRKSLLQKIKNIEKGLNLT